jgi:hypothetical protein
MDPPDLLQQLTIAHRASTYRARLGGVVGARSDLTPMLAQHGADRLDSELPTINARSAHEPVMTVLVDEPHERGDGRSSSAAKKAEAVFKIAFARRSSGSPPPAA